MKRSQITRLFLPVVFVAAFALTESCKQVDQVVQNLLTFSITKSAPGIPIPQVFPVGQTFATQGIPIGIDSATLNQQKTSLSLIRTVKLTAMGIGIDDSTVYPRTNIDTMTISVGSSQQNKILLATYVGGSIDQKTLTNTDFSTQLKNPKDSFYVTFRLKNDPPHTVNLLTSYTLTFSADPL
jgi:hypothetical protein